MRINCRVLETVTSRTHAATILAAKYLTPYTLIVPLVALNTMQAIRRSPTWGKDDFAPRRSWIWDGSFPFDKVE